MNHESRLLASDDVGLGCARGGFHVDPWGASPCALITHAHSDHVRGGSEVYYCAKDSQPLIEKRVPGAKVIGLEYGEVLALGDASVSLYPAGHCLGSAQVRVQAGHDQAGEVWVASGDYKRQADPTCDEFQVVPCDVFITEATFGLPIYRWEEPADVIDELVAWWRSCEERGKVAVLLAYSLGKAQRVLGELERAKGRAGSGWMQDRVVFVHSALEEMIDVYRRGGRELFPTAPVVNATDGKNTRESFAGQLVMAPPSAEMSPWITRLGEHDNVEIGFASGWMAMRGVRRRRGCDRGFVISDHADWPGLLQTIQETGCSKVLTTHGYSATLSRYLREQGMDASMLETQYANEEE
jgi:putative mRNA 3-end processing factor